MSDLEKYDEVIFVKKNGFSDNNKEKTLSRAWEIRNFEIELYWKRAIYFWGFIALCFAGYFKVYFEGNNDRGDSLLLIISFSGFFFSSAWFLVNKASKFWQENWEAHIDCLEDEVEGALYKTVMINKAGYFNPLLGYYFSVSKINQLCSFFVMLIWVYFLMGHLTGLFFFSVGEYIQISIKPSAFFLFPVMIGLTIILWLGCKTTFGQKGNLKSTGFSDSDYVCIKRLK